MAEELQNNIEELDKVFQETKIEIENDIDEIDQATDSYIAGLGYIKDDFIQEKTDQLRSYIASSDMEIRGEFIEADLIQKNELIAAFTEADAVIHANVDQNKAARESEYTTISANITAVESVINDFIAEHKTDFNSQDNNLESNIPDPIDGLIARKYYDSDDDGFFIDPDEYSSVRVMGVNLMVDNEDVAYRVDPNRNSVLKNVKLEKICIKNNCKTSWADLEYDDTQLQDDINVLQGLVTDLETDIVQNETDSDSRDAAISDNLAAVESVINDFIAEHKINVNNLGNPISSSPTSGQGIIMPIASSGRVTGLTAKKYYDTDDYDYYLDPSGDSQLNEIRASITFDKDNSDYQVDPNGVSKLNEVRASIIFDKDNDDYYLDPHDVSFLKAVLTDDIHANNLQANIIYDKNDSKYRIDPDGDSNLKNVDVERICIGGDCKSSWPNFESINEFKVNIIKTNIIHDKDNSDYQVDPNGVSKLNEVRASQIFTNIIHDKDNSDYQVDPNGVSKLNEVRASKIFDKDNSDYQVDPNGVSKLNEVRASKIFDKDNSDYQVDPNGVSKLNEIRASITFDKDNSDYQVDPNGVSKLNEVRASIIFDKDNDDYYLDPHDVSFLKAVLTDDIHANNLQANIIYDKNDSKYRIDPDGDSNLKNVEVERVCINEDCKTSWPDFESADAELEAEFKADLSDAEDKFENMIKELQRKMGGFSDQRLKRDIESVDNVLEKVMKVSLKSFKWKNQESPEKIIGFIAQEVEPYFPHLINTKKLQDSDDDTDYLTVVNNFGPLAFAGVRELKLEKDKNIASLNNKIKILKSAIIDLKNENNNLKEQLNQFETRIKDLESK